MSDGRAATIGALCGFVGVIMGALVAGVAAYKVAEVQLKQAEMSTRAASALNMRATLSEKASAFFAANEQFLYEVMSDETSKAAILAAAKSISTESSKLLPYLDGDLFVACGNINLSVQALVKVGEVGAVDRKSALDKYDDSYQKFLKLYLRLRRELERNAQVNVVDSQIDDQRNE